MSTPQAELKPTQRHASKLAPVQQALIVAAVAAGKSQTLVAQEFGVHVNTVAKYCKAVRNIDHPANPLGEGVKVGLIRESGQAIMRGLKCTRNPYEAARIGVTVLEDTGIFVRGPQVEINNTIQVGWEPVQECINVTPTANAQDMQVVDNITQHSETTT